MSLRSKAVQFTVIGAVAAAVTGIVAAPAQAGIYSWRFYGSYGTASECAAAGAEQVLTTEAVRYQCRGPNGTELYLAEIW